MAQVLTQLPKDTTLNGFAHLTSGTFATIKSNLGASTDPTVTSDTNAGYSVGSVWINTTLDKVFVCVDAGAGVAVWRSFIDSSLSPNYGVASGTNVYTVSLTPALQSYVNGQVVFIRFTNSNTAASTININSLGARNIFKNGIALNSGDISGNSLVVLAFNSTDNRFDMISGGASSGGASGGSSGIFRLMGA